MADEAEKTEDKKADADEGVTLDKLLSAVDGLCKRMDAMEAAKCDADEKEEAEKKADADPEAKDEPKEVAADKKADADEDDKEKADAEEEKAEEKAKADAALAVQAAENEALRKRLADIEAKLPKHLSDADFHALADAQARADKVYQAFGGSAPRPMNGEDLGSYRRRIANDLKSHSAKLKDVNVRDLKDEGAFKIMEDMIYADAVHAAHNPADLPAGQLREIQERDVTGRVVSKFAGQPRDWMSQFGGQSQSLTKINREHLH